MKEWPITGIRILEDTKLQSGKRRSSGREALLLRCIYFLFCMVGSLMMLMEALELNIQMESIFLGMLLACTATWLSFIGKGKWKYSRILWAGILAVSYLLRWRVMISSYLVIENAVRRRLADYYQFTLAQRTIPFPEEDGRLFLTAVFSVLILLLGGLVVRKGRTAILAMSQILFFTGELLCGCRFEGWGIYLMAGSLLGLLAMRNRKGGRSLRIQFGGGIWAGAVILGLTVLCGTILGPRLFRNVNEYNKELYSTMRRMTDQVSAMMQGQNGFFGNHTPTADGSLNNYSVEQDEKTDIRITVSERPEHSVYLRGYIGDTYEGSYWHKIDENDFLASFPEADAAYEVQNILYQYALNHAPEAAGTAVIEKVRPGGEYGYVPYGFETPNDANLQGDSYYTSAEEKMEYQGYVNWRGWLGEGADQETASDMEVRYREYVANQYLKIPVHNLDRLKEYCAQWNFDTVQEVVDFVVADVQADRPYSMDLDPVPENTDFAEYFFFDQKKGYCIHYATTATLMFRLMGVPARYATGYVAPADLFTETEEGYTAEVPDSQAHAWVEIYRSGKGWIPVEVTPGYSLGSGEDLGGQEDFLQQPTPESEQDPAPEQETVTPQPKEPEEIPPETSPEDTQGTGGTEKEPGETDAGTELTGRIWKAVRVSLLIAFAALFILAAVLAFFWANRKRILNMRSRKFMQKDRNQAICEISYGLYRMLQDAQIAEAVSRDMEYARRMQEKLSFLEKEEYTDFVRLVQRAAYGPQQLTEEERQTCLQFYHKIALSLWQQMTKRKKIWWKYMKCYEIS